jgi:hypothetical protein
MSQPKDKQIQSLNSDPLANLSIEELEERLEMQMLVFHVTPNDSCATFSCGTFNGSCPANVSCGSFKPI